MPYFKINGRDITKYIKMDGFKESENDIDSAKSGRATNALMYRGKVAEKKRADIECVPVKKEVIDWMMPILRKQYFSFETDLFAGNAELTLEMYNSTRKYNVAIIDVFGCVWYTGVSFNVVER